LLKFFDITKDIYKLAETIYYKIKKEISSLKAFLFYYDFGNLDAFQKLIIYFFFVLTLKLI